MINSNTKSHMIAFLVLILVATIPAIAAWSQMPTKSNFKFAPETHIVNVAPMTVTSSDVSSVPEVKITAKVPAKSAKHIARSASLPKECHLHELLQGGSPDAPHVLSCG
jgi:hypothetical protein